jgi:hypothetical protein
LITAASRSFLAPTQSSAASSPQTITPDARRKRSGVPRRNWKQDRKITNQN